MFRCRLTALTTLIAALIFEFSAPVVHAHGGGHGGGGHGGYGGYHGGFGHGGYGYRGFGYGGYGFRRFGYGFGYPGFGYGFGYGLGYGLGWGGLGYGGLGYGGLGYGGLGFGYGGLGYGYGGLGYGGYGYGGCYPGYGGYGYGLGYGLGYGGYGGIYPISDGPAAAGNGSFLPVSMAGSRSPYVDYYTRTSPSTQPSLIASRSAGAPSRYVDYYASNSRPVALVQPQEEGLVRTVSLTPDNQARIHVALPTNAKLWVNGQPLKAMGPEREYVSAKLLPDQVYTCRLKAAWTDNGRAFEESIEVKVRANKTTRATFGTPLP